MLISTIQYITSSLNFTHFIMINQPSLNTSICSSFSIAVTRLHEKNATRYILQTTTINFAKAEPPAKSEKDKD